MSDEALRLLRSSQSLRFPSECVVVPPLPVVLGWACSMTAGRGGGGGGGRAAGAAHRRAGQGVVRRGGAGRSNHNDVSVRGGGRLCLMSPAASWCIRTKKRPDATQEKKN